MLNENVTLGTWLTNIYQVTVNLTNANKCQEVKDKA